MNTSISSDNFHSCDSNSSFESVDVPLSDLLQNAFMSVQRNLNICHINAQSIPAHHSELLNTFKCNYIHACLISESFLKPTLPSSYYSLPGYVLIRNDRTGKGGGGVAIYLRSNIKYKIIDQSPTTYSNNMEYILIEISIAGVAFLLGVVYAPPTVKYFETLEQLLETFLPNYEHCLIMGDFNTCILRDDHRTRKLKHVSNSSNLIILGLNPTFHTNDACSLLDLILTTNPDYILTHGQFAAPGFSHHDLIFASYKLKPAKVLPKLVYQRGLTRINKDALLFDAMNADWSQIEKLRHIDDKVECFNKILITLYDKHAPVKAVRIKRLPAPWMTDNIRGLMARRDKLKRKFKVNRSDEAWTAFKTARNRCNQAIRNAKRRYSFSSIEECPPQKLWDLLRTMGFGKRRNHLDSNFDVNALNTHFCNSSFQLDALTQSNTISKVTALPLPGHSSFRFEATSDCEVKRIISSVTSKAVGYDEIGREMILMVLDVVVPFITHILNSSLTTGLFPTMWKNAHIIPIPKKNNPTDVTHFRPISILPFLSKILERIVHHQFSKFLNKNVLLNSLQSGFRPSHSTCTALIKITDDIRYAIDRTQITLIALLDFSNAFNCVDHEILLAILRSLNISQSVGEWFLSYLRGRRQCVRADDVFSDWTDTTAGVPQGGVLSPLLFSVFINTLVSVLNFSSYHLYADDLQLYISFNAENVLDSIDKMNKDLEAIRIWTVNHGLLVNTSKTQVMLIGRPRQISKLDLNSLPKVTFNNMKLPYSTQVKNLGLYITQDLSWSSHVGEISRKIFAAMHALKRMQNMLPQKAKLVLVNSLLLPIIDYADICYTDLTEELLSKLDRLLNLCIRYIYGLRKFDHISKFRSELGWLNIRFRRNAHVLACLYGILNDPRSPKYLQERFNLFGSSGRVQRSLNVDILAFPKHSTKLYSDSFTVTAIKLWNALPQSVRHAPSLNVFKIRVHKHFLKSQNLSM